MDGNSHSLSLSAYARHRRAMGLTGGTLQAVQTAVKGGRLRTSLTPDGRITGAAEADAEWARNTLSNRIPHTGPTSGDASAMPPELGESRARKEAAQAALAELELSEKRGEVVPARDVEERLVQVFSSCKVKLLGIPSRVRQRDPSLTSKQIALIESLVREALDDLADNGV